MTLQAQAAKTEYFQWLAFQSGLQSRLFDDGVVIDLMKIIFIIIYFSSERRHYDSFPDFTPSSDANWYNMILFILALTSVALKEIP